MEITCHQWIRHETLVVLVLPCCAWPWMWGFVNLSLLRIGNGNWRTSSVWGSSIYLWGRKHMCTNIVIQCDSCGYLWFVAVAYALVLHRLNFWSTSYRLRSWLWCGCLFGEALDGFVGAVIYRHFEGNYDNSRSLARMEFHLKIPASELSSRFLAGQ